MRIYSFRLDFEDGTYSVSDVEAASIEEASERLAKPSDVVTTMLLGSRGLKPETFLAW